MLTIRLESPFQYNLLRSLCKEPSPAYLHEPSGHPENKNPEKRPDNGFIVITASPEGFMKSVLIRKIRVGGKNPHRRGFRPLIREQRSVLDIIP